MVSNNGKIKHISDLVPDPANARKHTPRNTGMIEKALGEVGAARSIVIDEAGIILAGNATIEAAAAAGIEKVQVVDADGETIIAVRRSGLTDEQKKRLALFDNRAAELADWDVGQLLADYESGLPINDLWTDEEFSALLEGAADGLLAGDGNGKDAEPQVDKAKELAEHWGTKTGQVWQLGEHRLVVGDCTDKTVIEVLMRGEQAETLMVDPPFYVREDKWDKFDSDESFVDFTSLWLGLANPIADTVVSFMADKNVPQLFLAAARVGLPYRRALIWRKPPGSQFAGASLDGFWFDFEIIQVFGKPKFEPDKYTKMAVLEHRTITGQEHGCEKPIELLMDLVNGYSTPGGRVIDFFNGTGTTLIACENLNRRCRGVEIDEGYAAVTIQRWVDLTGGTPKLLTP